MIRKRFLDELESAYHQRKYLSSDPLEFAHRFKEPLDQEAVALVSALLAYGNVKQIRSSVQNVLDRMALLETSPSRFVMALGNPRFVARAENGFVGFVHRFNRGTDLTVLLRLLSRSWSEYGSLGTHFAQSLSASDETIASALNALVATWSAWAGSAMETPFSYFLTAPRDGSCCKRWCMFLRWMVRVDSREKLDLGLWRDRVRPDQLVIPLDTHTGRISRYLGLTDRKTLDWRAALEVTNSLKRFDPEDPTRYDFALARLGILDLCQRRYRKEICRKCQLFHGCRFAQTRGERIHEAASAH